MAVADVSPSERSSYGTLLVFLALVLVGTPLAHAVGVGELIGRALMTALVFSGFLFVRRRNLLFRVAKVLAVVAIAAAVAASVSEAFGGPLFHLIVTVYLALTTAAMLGEVLGPGSVDVHKLYGAICAYLFAALAWGSAYAFIESVVPGAFRYPDAVVVAGGSRTADLLYFSFVTISTVGYGDIVPKLQWVRILATTEAIAGQLYLAILVGRLVGLTVAERRGEGDPAPADPIS